MKKETKMQVIEKWHLATENLAKVFTEKYFSSQKYGVDAYWVGDEIGSVYYVTDRFFDVNGMVEALELNATFEQLSEYYDAEVEAGMKEPPEKPKVNFKNYVKYGLEL